MSNEGKRVLVWALTPSGYALAAEELGREFKVPRHDVAHQFLEHATGVNDLYVALTKRMGAARTARRGKPADDYAPLPSTFRWVPTEELDLQFKEFSWDAAASTDCRLQPDAMIEDPLRKRRYLLEFETGSATVRSSQHKTATLTKIARYNKFLLGRANFTGDETFYGKHFRDGYKPVVVFLTRSEARRDTIRKAAAEQWGTVDVRFDIEALTLAEAASQFRLRLLGEAPAANAPAQAKAPRADGVVVSSRELDLLKEFQDEALAIIQRVRHMVRTGSAVKTEPPYPTSTQAAAMLLHRLRR